jgi:hypothetical protein
MTCHAARRIPVSLAYVDAEADVDRCPFLVDRTPDWRVGHRPTDVCRRPDEHIRIPSAATLAARCLGGRFRDCDGYVSFAAQPDVAAPDG